MATNEFNRYNEFLVNTSKDDNLMQESIVKPMTPETSDVFFGGKAIGEQSIGVLRANLIITGILQSPNGQTGFDLDNAKIFLSDGTDVRVLLDGNAPKFVITKLGFDANTAGPADSIIYVDNTGAKVYFSKTFSSPSNTAPDAFTGAVAALVFESSNDTNAVLNVDFYKDPLWTITDVKLQLRFTPGYADNGGGGYDPRYQINNKVYLNPTQTFVPDHPFGYYFKYSGGTVLRMDGEGADAFNLTALKLTFTDTLTPTEVSAISDGWNRATVQTDNDDGSYIAYGVINITLIGYETVI